VNILEESRFGIKNENESEQDRTWDDMIIILPKVEKSITVKYENENRTFDYDEETMILTITDKFIVNKEDLPQILENINNLPDCED
jgi:hypothetical protein